MKRWASLLITLACFAAIVAVTVAFVIPAFRSIIRLHTETVVEYEQLERRYQSSLARSRVQRELATLGQTVSALRNRIPDAPEALAFVRSIEDIAAVHHLEVRIAIDWSAMNEATAQRAGRVTGTPITIEFDGQYPFLIAALRDLERLPLPLAAQTLTISNNAANSASAPATRAKLVVQSRALWRAGQ